MSVSSPIPRTIAASSLAPGDAINEEIWTQSAALQAAMQPPRAGWAAGEVGAQQSMCGESALPWVPDLVGCELASPSAVLFVGMSYAGFIRRSGRRNGLIPPEDYLAASAAEFADRFAEVVVPRYPYYQHLLDALPADVATAQVAFTDLCRACFVKVGRKDDSNSSVERADKALFSRYVDHPDQQRWHQRRILGSGARLLVAVGHVAEHGLLRLLRDGLGCEVRCGAGRVEFSRRSAAHSWPTAYAHDRRQIGAWASTNDWWEAVSAGRRWNVVTVPHTSESPLDAVHIDRIRRAWEEAQRAG